MKPDKEPRTYSHDIKLGNGVIAVDGREYPAEVIRLERTVQEYRAPNGEVCRQENLHTRITILS